MNLKNIYHDVLVKQALNPQSGDNVTLNGAVIDLAGYEGVGFEFLVGATDIGVTCKVQSGNQPDGSDMTDVPGLSQAYIATDDNKPTVLNLHRSPKRYARAVAVIGDGTTGAFIAAAANLYGGRVFPVVQDFGGAFVAPQGVVI